MVDEKVELTTIVFVKSTTSVHVVIALPFLGSSGCEGHFPFALRFSPPSPHYSRNKNQGHNDSQTQDDT